MADHEVDEVSKLAARVAELEAELREARGKVHGPMTAPITEPTDANILFAAVEKTRMPMIVTDPKQPDNPIIFVNRAFVALSGYGVDELIGRNCRFLQGPGTDKGDVAKIREAIATRRDIAIDILNYRRDGSSFVNELYISPVFDRSGDLLYFFGSQVDLTHYREDRRALKASEVRYRSLFESIDAGFCVFEMKFNENGKAIDYRFTEVNPVFAEQTGLHDAVGKWMTDLAPAHEQKWFDLYGEVAKTQRSIRVEDYAAALGRHYEIQAYPIGKPSENRVAALFNDVTARKSVEADLKALNETLEQQVQERTDALMLSEDARRQSQKMEAIGQLTGGVAHDFNNLLTIISSAADFLRRGDLADEKRQRYVAAISDTAKRAAKLTSQLLAFARRQPLKAEVFDIGERIARNVDLIRSLVGTSIEIEAHGCEHGLCTVEADPAQFETAIVNLAVNARDAMNGEGKLRITSFETDEIPAVRHHPARRGDYIAVAITDEGSGIPPDQIERVFEPFYTTKEVGKGTGLGLSQVFGFAKQSGGDVTVESSPAGTTFILYLPAKAVTPHVVPDAGDRTAPASTHNACILVVEDNPEVGQFSTEVLHDLGYRTKWVMSGDAALKALADDASFDLVFSDVVMPGMNGVDLALEIRRTYPDLPVVLTSGYSTVLAEEGTHGFDLIRKPYSTEGIAEVFKRKLTEAGRTETTSGAG